MKCKDYILLSAPNVTWREHVIGKGRGFEGIFGLRSSMHSKNKSNIKSLLLRSKGDGQVVIVGNF